MGLFTAMLLVTVVAIGTAVTLMSKNWVYPLPIAWGLAAVWVAEQSDRPMVALLAVAGAAIVAGAAPCATTAQRGAVCGARVTEGADERAPSSRPSARLSGSRMRYAPSAHPRQYFVG